MENKPLVPANTPSNPTPAVPEPVVKPVKAKEHFAVELAGGITIASTMVAGLSMFYAFLVTLIGS